MLGQLYPLIQLIASHRNKELSLMTHTGHEAMASKSCFFEIDCESRVLTGSGEVTKAYLHVLG